MQEDQPLLNQLWAGFEDCIIEPKDKPSTRLPCRHNVSCYKG